MIEFTLNKSRELIPKTWRKLLSGEKISASIVCPNGHYGVLIDHDIGSDGTVSPSVVCPEEGCKFHDYVKLLGWKA